MSCNCHCNSKCHLLGGLEQQVMDILWSSTASLKPAEVQKKLKNQFAYTTIMTILKRLADKKLVVRKAIGNAFAYSPVKSKEDFACTCLDDLFERLFQSYGQCVITSFKKVAQKSGFKI